MLANQVDIRSAKATVSMHACTVLVHACRPHKRVKSVTWLLAFATSISPHCGFTFIKIIYFNFYSQVKKNYFKFLNKFKINNLYKNNLFIIKESLLILKKIKQAHS